MIISTGLDVAGTEEAPEKGKTPKERLFCRIVSGCRVKNPVTVIRVDGELPEDMYPQQRWDCMEGLKHLPQPFFFR